MSSSAFVHQERKRLLKQYSFVRVALRKNDATKARAARKIERREFILAVLHVEELLIEKENKKENKAQVRVMNKLKEEHERNERDKYERMLDHQFRQGQVSGMRMRKRRTAMWDEIINDIHNYISAILNIYVLLRMCFFLFCPHQLHLSSPPVKLDLLININGVMDDAISPHADASPFSVASSCRFDLAHNLSTLSVNEESALYHYTHDDDHETRAFGEMEKHMEMEFKKLHQV